MLGHCKMYNTAYGNIFHMNTNSPIIQRCHECEFPPLFSGVMNAKFPHIYSKNSSSWILNKELGPLISHQITTNFKTNHLHNSWIATTKLFPRSENQIKHHVVHNFALIYAGPEERPKNVAEPVSNFIMFKGDLTANDIQASTRYAREHWQPHWVHYIPNKSGSLRQEQYVTNGSINGKLFF